MVVQSPQQRERVALILAAVRGRAARSARPALAVIVGLPGSGKTRVAQELRSRTGAVVLESDELRRLLFPQWTYSAEESRLLFSAIHDAIDELLADGASVVLDATNVEEAERAPLYDIAQARRAKLVLAHVTAPDRVIRRRLEDRRGDGVSRSEANVTVYERMRLRMESIQREHHVVDTSGENESTLAAIAREMTAS